jgi:hypothetical protein
MKTIIDNGEELSVSETNISILLTRGLIYYCTDCGFYHPNDVSLDYIESEILTF